MSERTTERGKARELQGRTEAKLMKVCVATVGMSRTQRVENAPASPCCEVEQGWRHRLDPFTPTAGIRLEDFARDETRHRSSKIRRNEERLRLRLILFVSNGVSGRRDENNRKRKPNRCFTMSTASHRAIPTLRLMQELSHTCMSRLLRAATSPNRPKPP